MKLTWPVVVLACVFVVAFLGACCFLIATEKAPASLLVVPFTSVLSAIAGGAVFYVREHFKLPPPPPGFDGWKPVKSLPPPPTADELAGHEVSVPPWDASVHVEREVHDDSK